MRIICSDRRYRANKYAHCSIGTCEGESFRQVPVLELRKERIQTRGGMLHISTANTVALMASIENMAAVN